MSIDEIILKPDERVACVLRSLYRSFGYSQYKMSKFEEYALYVKNKDFLVSDGIISFTDTNGRLLALKPDVTLSIIKNSKDLPGVSQKLYYDENVYRISKNSRSFKEIRQTGLECIGTANLIETVEVIYLALRSLESISKNYVLEISHIGLVEAIMNQYGIEESLAAKLLTAISRKSSDELYSLCKQNDVSSEACNALTVLTENFPDTSRALYYINEICHSQDAKINFSNLSHIVQFIRQKGYGENIKIDFSIANDMNYYSGVVFKGYIEGIPASVLSGGNYDKLMRKMGRRANAIGFAVYLDALERFNMEDNEYDVDFLLVHDSSAENIAEIIEKAEELSRSGASVRICCEVPSEIRYRKLLRITKEGDITDENA